MKKWIRIIIAALILLFVAAIAGYYLLVRGLDEKSLKKMLASAARDVTGRELTIKGKAELKIGLNPRLLLNDLYLGNADWAQGEALIMAKSLELEIMLFALIKKRIEIKRLIIDDPVIWIEKKKNGEFNFEFKKDRKASSGKKEPKKPKIGLGRFILKNASFFYMDHSNNRRLEADFKRVDIRSEALQKSFKIKIEGNVSGFSFKSEADITIPKDRSVIIDRIDVTLPAGRITGRIAVSPGNTPRIDADLRSKSLSLARLLPEKGPDSPQGPRPRLFKTRPLLIPPKGGFSVHAKIYVDRVDLGKIELNRLLTEVFFRNNEVSIRGFSARIADGLFAGSLLFTGSAGIPVLNAELDLKGIDVERLLKETNVPPAAGGRADARLLLTCSGKNPLELMSTSNGHIGFVVKNGFLKSRYLHLFNKNLVGVLLSFFKKGEYEKMPLNCLAGRFDITGGRAELSAFFAETDSLSITGSGYCDLGTEKLFMKFRPRIKKGLFPIKAGIKSLAKPFALGGTLTKPEMVIDKSETAMLIGKALGGAAILGPAGFAAALIDIPGKKISCQQAESAAMGN